MLIIASYPRGHLIMALFTFYASHSSFKAEKLNSTGTFSSFFFLDYMSANEKLGRRASTDSGRSKSSGCVLRRATFTTYLHSHPRALSQALGPTASPHRHTRSPSAWAYSNLTAKTKQHIAEVSPPHRGHKSALNTHTKMHMDT